MAIARLVAALLSVAAAPAADLRLACVGDSITAGYGAAQGEAYPAQLQRLLGKGWEPMLNFGVSGATLARSGDKPYWGQQHGPGRPLLQQVIARQPDAVLLMLGTNDAKPANQARHPDLTGDYRAMVEALRGARSHPTVYAMLPLPGAGEGAFAIAPAAIESDIVPTLQAAADALRLPRIDVRGAFVGHPELLPDRIHPGAAGYRLIAERVAAALATCPAFTPRGDVFSDRAEAVIAVPPGTEVHYTLDGTLPTAASPRCTGPIALAATTTVTAAVFRDGIAGLPASATWTRMAPLPAHAAAGAPGLRCAVYERNARSNIWRLEWDEALLVRTVDVRGIHLPEAPGTAQGLAFSGSLVVPAEGVWTFAVSSSDGSSLAIDGEVVVENGDMHGPRERSGRIALAAGAHDLALRWFSEGRGRTLAVSWEGPGIPRQSLPDSACRRPAGEVR